MEEQDQEKEFQDIFVSSKLSCQQEMERSYYSAKCFTAVCFNSGVADVTIPDSNDTYPYCDECETNPGFKRKYEKG